MKDHDTYFIGYDAREHEAAAVAAYSIQRRTTRQSRIYILEHQMLRRLGLFWRTWTVGPNGQFLDMEDGKPFSTGFSHARFLAFHIARELECKGPCMFVDCDWLFLSDPSKLMDQQRYHHDRIGVVMRDRQVAENSLKMDGMIQQNYPRKLWSALFTFMPSDRLAAAFSPKVVNHTPGSELHTFLDIPRSDFWAIDPAWHYIPSLDEPLETIKGVHFSEFSPWLNPERGADTPEVFSKWHSERDFWLDHIAYSRSISPWDDLSMELETSRLDA